MKIAILGTGNVGAALGKAWAAKGHEIVFGSRDPQTSRITELLNVIGENVRAMSVPQAVEWAPTVVLATPWEVTQRVIASAGSFEGKILLDCTNPIKSALDGLEIGTTTSAAEMIAEWVPGAAVVKAFNCTGAANMRNPLYGLEAATMFIAGDDAEANYIALRLADDLGFDTIDAGPLRVARYLEPLAMLWVHLAYIEGRGTNIAFKLMSR
jgi:hypothetical protein